MAEGRTTSAAWLRGVVDMFAGHGVAPARLFEAARIDIARLRQPHMRFAIEEVNRLWELAVAWTGDEALGLDPQIAAKYVNFDISAHAMWPGPTLRDGLDGLSRYLHLIDDVSYFTVEPVLEGAWLVIVNATHPAMLRQRTAYGVLALLKLCRRVTGVALRPLQMEFHAPDPVDFHPYRRAFACPLRFGQPATRMLLSEESLALPLVRARSMFEVQERVAEQRLATVGHLRTTYRVGEEVLRRLHLGVPTAAAVAQAMDVKERTLAQRLKAEQTSYERVLDEVRRDLARAYLGDAGYPLTRLPALVGYDSGAEFAAACRAWFRLAPNELRALLLADGSPPGTGG
jgi:AraC-like DNA-binding protein